MLAFVWMYSWPLLESTHSYNFQDVRFKFNVFIMKETKIVHFSLLVGCYSFFCSSYITIVMLVPFLFISSKRMLQALFVDVASFIFCS